MRRLVCSCVPDIKLLSAESYCFFFTAFPYIFRTMTRPGFFPKCSLRGVMYQATICRKVSRRRENRPTGRDLPKACRSACKENSANFRHFRPGTEISEDLRKKLQRPEAKTTDRCKKNDRQLPREDILHKFGGNSTRSNARKNRHT